MRFLVLGGAGAMGRRVVRELAVSDGVTLVTIAGRNAAAAAEARALAVASQAAASLPESRRAQVRTATLDIGDHDATVRLMADHDVAVGAAGPFYLLEEPLVRAAIAARRPYVSICDDGDAAQRVLALDEEARDAGVAIITGLGWTPGLTNLTARKLADQMDQVQRIHIAWAGTATNSDGRATTLHSMYMFTGKVVTHAGGRQQWVQAGSGTQRVRFPDPVGTLTVHHVGHPETITLPRFLPGVEEVWLKGGLGERLLDVLGVALGRLGVTGSHRRRQVLAAIIDPLLPVLARLSPPAHPLSAFVVEVYGRREGRAVSLAAGAVGHMADLTAVPLAQGALWLASGRVGRTGVFAPEADGGLDAAAFLAELVGRGIQVAPLGHPIIGNGRPER